jgi:fumarylacetoacetate (FAA) hydrolase
MKLGRWAVDGGERIGLVEGDVAVPVGAAPDASTGDRLLVAIAMGDAPTEPIAEPVELATVRLLPPVRRPPSIRDFYAFEGHVATARRGRGLDVDPDWYELPVFYFSNPHTVIGPEDTVPHPATAELDYELEVGIVVGREARDLDAEAALEAIAGYTVFNDFSARDVQRREMRQGLGPAKGKDFASALGPVLVTPDELTGSRARPTAAMTARVNGVEWSRGDLGELHHPVGVLLAQAARDSVLRPGDVIGTGTVGTGCILELSISHGSQRYPYLGPGDVVELEVEGIGTLRNVIGDRSDLPVTP